MINGRLFDIEGASSFQPANGGPSEHSSALMASHFCRSGYQLLSAPALIQAAIMESCEDDSFPPGGMRPVLTVV